MGRWRSRHRGSGRGDLDRPADGRAGPVRAHRTATARFFGPVPDHPSSSISNGSFPRRGKWVRAHYGSVIGGPETRYAKTPDGVHVAFQVMGDGPLDLLCVGYGNMVSIDLRDDEPHFRRFERRLGSFSRFIRFDPRGLGLSDPIASGSPSGLEQGVDDLIAVLDAIDSPRAALFAVGGSCLTALMAAATHPDRISSLVLIHGYARLPSAQDYPIGVPQEFLDGFIDAVLDVGDDAASSGGDIDLLAPSLSGDQEFRAWWKRAGQRSASPASARLMLTMTFNGDVRAALPLVVAPTLLLHRRQSPFAVPLSRYLPITFQMHASSSFRVETISPTRGIPTPSETRSKNSSRACVETQVRTAF